MQNDLISRSALGVGRCNPDIMLDKAYAAGWNGLLNIINAAPAVDAVPVVRCKDCKSSFEAARDMGGYFCCPTCNAYMCDNDFCSYGTKMKMEDTP